MKLFSRKGTVYYSLMKISIKIVWSLWWIIHSRREKMHGFKNIAGLITMKETLRRNQLTWFCQLAPKQIVLFFFPKFFGTMSSKYHFRVRKSSMRNFKEMTIWNEGINLALEVYKATKTFPKEEAYGLKSQLRRAAVSIPSNIAEGCSRGSQKEFKHYLEISLGSAFEIETDIILAQRLSMIPERDATTFLKALLIEQRRINALIIKVRDL